MLVAPIQSYDPYLAAGRINISYPPEDYGKREITGLFADIPPISLDQTNSLASLQSRVDNKYLVDIAQFSAFLKSTSARYTVLEIEQRRTFCYRSCYYDDDFNCYLEHHQGRRQRLKVRTREYVDGGGLKFLEIKLKGVRGATIKHRSATENLVNSRIEGDELDMLRSIYSQQYKKVLTLDLRPALFVGYKRATLVALEGGERVTVDFHLNFAAPGAQGGAVQLGGDFIVLETKSRDGKGIADKALKKLKIRKASQCSKYCIGVNLVGSVKKNNIFLSTTRRALRNLVAPGLERRTDKLLLA